MVLTVAIILFLILPHPADLVVLGLGAIGEIGEIVWGRRLAKRWRPKTGPEAMIGATAEVVAAVPARGPGPRARRALGGALRGRGGGRGHGHDHGARRPGPDRDADGRPVSDAAGMQAAPASAERPGAYGRESAAAWPARVSVTSRWSSAA